MIPVSARPYDFDLDPSKVALIVIDMQRDFIEPGGFGAVLGNDVSRLLPAIPAVARLLKLFRTRGWPVIHTREAHRPDLSDCPPAKRLRGKPGLRIGDDGAMGRILIAGEPGNQIVPELAPMPGEIELWAEYRLMADLTVGAATNGLALGMSYLPIKHLRVGMGYSFTAVPDQLTTSETVDGSGFFIRISGLY